MIVVNRKTIHEDPINIIGELKVQLHAQGIERFAIVRDGGADVMTTCPMHKDGQERKPSCGITKQDVQRGKRTIKAGTVHCFTCGYTASLEVMVSQLFGYDDNGYQGAKWLIRNFSSFEAVERKPVAITTSRDSGPADWLSGLEYISEQELDGYRYIHDYMYERKLTDDVIELFDVGYQKRFKVLDKDGEVANTMAVLTFPVHDRYGNVTFITRRSVKGKYFNIPTGVEKVLYGEYQVRKQADKSSRVFVTEAQIDCLTIWGYGEQAVALFGTGTTEQAELLLALPQREIILALDGDKAGLRGTQRLLKELKGKKLVGVLDIPNGADINDLDEEEFKTLDIVY